MDFKKSQTIYQQIADIVKENILTKKWIVGEKISSVRELAAEIEVNPNTVMRSYSSLQEQGVLFNKRGIGFFVAENAQKIIHNMDKERFINEELPNIFKKMNLLKIDFEELKKIYTKSKFK